MDVFVAHHTGLSRNKVQRLIADGLVTVDDKPARKNHHMVRGEHVSWTIPPPEPEDIVPQEIPLDIIYEDDDIAVIDKPAGMVMYPGPGHQEGTMLNALLAGYPNLAGVGGKGRPGIFHRLDKGTSGLVAVALTEQAYQDMVEKVKNREVKRFYTALVTGDLSVQQGTIDAPMGRSPRHRKKMTVTTRRGKKAITAFEVTERFPSGYTLVEVELMTGRTHQIRVHFSHIGHPVAGDPEYSRGRGRKELGLDRQFLHAHRLSFSHPVTGEQMEFESELPDDLAVVLNRLREKNGRP